MQLWVLGALINVVGSLTVNLAANLMKKSHNMQTKMEKGASAALVEQQGSAGCCDGGGNNLSPLCYWRLGALLFALGSGVNFVSLGMAAQSLLAILGGVQFVSNIFFGRVILQEKVTVQAVLGTVFIIVGLSVAVSFSDHRNRRFNTEDLIALYDDTYIEFLIGVFAVLVACESVYVFFTTYEDTHAKPLPFSKIVRPVTYSVVSATVGTQSVLQSKCIAELLRTEVESGDPTGESVLRSGFFAVVCLLFLVGLAFWLYRLNNALKLFDGLVIIPIIQVFWTLSAVVQGGMYFHEFRSFTRSQGGFYFLGAVFVFSGVICIASTATHTQSTPSPIPTAHAHSGRGITLAVTLDVTADVGGERGAAAGGGERDDGDEEEAQILMGDGQTDGKSGHGHGSGRLYARDAGDPFRRPAEAPPASPVSSPSIWTRIVSPFSSPLKSPPMRVSDVDGSSPPGTDASSRPLLAADT